MIGDQTLHSLGRDHAFRTPLSRVDFLDVYRLDIDSGGRQAYQRYIALRTYYRAKALGFVEEPPSSPAQTAPSPRSA